MTILNLPRLVEDPGKKAELDELVNTAKSKAEFCRDWRNRHIAHRDLDLLMNGSAKPLKTASGIQVRDGLDAIESVLNEVHLHYMGGSLAFSRNIGEAGNALSLLRLLHDGLRAREGEDSRGIPILKIYPARTKLSNTIFRPALSKSMVSLLPSTAATVPAPNFV